MIVANIYDFWNRHLWFAQEKRFSCCCTGYVAGKGNNLGLGTNLLCLTSTTPIHQDVAGIWGQIYGTTYFYSRAKRRPLIFSAPLAGPVSRPSSWYPALPRVLRDGRPSTMDTCSHRIRNLSRLSTFAWTKTLKAYQYTVIAYQVSLPRKPGLYGYTLPPPPPPTTSTTGSTVLSVLSRHPGNKEYLTCPSTHPPQPPRLSGCGCCSTSLKSCRPQQREGSFSC